MTANDLLLLHHTHFSTLFRSLFPHAFPSSHWRPAAAAATAKVDMPLGAGLGRLDPIRPVSDKNAQKAAGLDWTGVDGRHLPMRIIIAQGKD